MRDTKGREDAGPLIDLAMRMQVPALVHLLAELIEHEPARAALDRLAERHPAAALKTVVEQAFAGRAWPKAGPGSWRCANPPRWRRCSRRCPAAIACGLKR